MLDLAEAAAEELAESGFAVLPHLLAPADVVRVREALDALLDAQQVPSLRTEDGRFAGIATKRVYDPLARSRIVDELALHPVVTAVLDAALGPHRQLGMTIVSRIGGRQAAQPLHYDAGIYPLRGFGRDVEVNAIWAIDAFTEANGATVVNPGSHRWPKGRRPTDSDLQLAVEMPPGSVLLYSGDLWHGSGENSNGERRLGVILEYVLAWLRPAENHTLAIPADVLRTLPAKLLDLVGLSQPSPYFGFVAGQPPQTWLQAGLDTTSS